MLRTTTALTVVHAGNKEQVLPGNAEAVVNFRDLTDNIYRFSPVRAQSEDLQRFHGTNERVAVSNYTEMIRFYQRLLSNVAAPGYAQ